MNGALPVISLLAFDPSRRLQIIERSPRPLPSVATACLIHGLLHNGHSIISLNPTRSIRKSPLQRIQCIDINPRVLRAKHAKKLRTEFVVKSRGKIRHNRPLLRC